MIELTQKKLREAKFFLGQLNVENRKPVRSEPDAFEFYLSAFLSAARAVTFALQHEDKDKYDAWFPAWKNNRAGNDRHLLDFMVRQRNNVQKRGGPEVSADWTYIPITEARLGDRTHPAYGFHWFGPPGAPPPQVGVKVFSFEGSGEEVKAMCTRYVTILDDLVRDFLEAHSGT